MNFTKGYNRTSTNDDCDEVRIITIPSRPFAKSCYRKHFDELKYLAPRTVSKLVDQVSAASRMLIAFLMSLTRFSYSEIVIRVVCRVVKKYNNGFIMVHNKVERGGGVRGLPPQGTTREIGSHNCSLR
jgi:hypothetical protein